MKRYAFIDVQNTETTALKVLNFIVDWQKLITYLEKRWLCEKIFLYPGIQETDIIRSDMFLKLAGSMSQVIVRPKYYRVYKNEDRINKVLCPNCHIDVVQKIDMGYSWKCNCDVELTLDVILFAKENTEILLFTGDGDFAFLIEDIVKKGTKVTIFSSALSIQKNGRSVNKRLSTKLKKLTDEQGSPVRFIELSNIERLINKAL